MEEQKKKKTLMIVVIIAIVALLLIMSYGLIGITVLDSQSLNNVTLNINIT